MFQFEQENDLSKKNMYAHQRNKYIKNQANIWYLVNVIYH